MSTVTAPVISRRRIPTTVWVSRETKDEVERAVQDGQACHLCEFGTSKRRIRIHVRQHFCVHYCHCGYAHVSRDQVADHQKTTRKAGHSRSRCQIFMVSGDQFPTFRDAMKWSANVTFGPLLPVTRKINRVVVTPRPSVNPPVDRRPVTATVTSSQPLATGYRIPKRIRISPAPETDDSPAEPPASLPVSPRATDNSLPESEAQGRRRWQTNTSPRIEVVEVHARTNLERLLGRSQPSKSIPGLRARRAVMLEQDADDIEHRARRVDDVRRGSRLSQTEEESLRRESAQLRTEAAKFRQVVDLLYN